MSEIGGGNATKGLQQPKTSKEEEEGALVFVLRGKVHAMDRERAAVVTVAILFWKSNWTLSDPSISSSLLRESRRMNIWITFLGARWELYLDNNRQWVYIEDITKQWL